MILKLRLVNSIINLIRLLQIFLHVIAMCYPNYVILIATLFTALRLGICQKLVFLCYNKAVRRMLHLPYQTHCDLLSPILGIPHIKDQVACRFLKMYNSMYNSNNVLIRNMAIRCMHSSNTSIGSTVLHLSNRYKFHMSSLLVPKINNVTKMCRNTISNVHIVSAICHILDGELDSLFPGDVAVDFLWHLCCQ